MYDQTHPAESINELLSALEQEDHGNYLYRGQTRHRESILPSVFRKSLTGSTLAPHLHAIDATEFHKNLGVQGLLRFRVLAWLIETLGRGVGNLVAQQYLVS